MNLFAHGDIFLVLSSTRVANTLVELGGTLAILYCIKYGMKFHKMACHWAAYPIYDNDLLWVAVATFYLKYLQYS